MTILFLPLLDILRVSYINICLQKTQISLCVSSGSKTGSRNPALWPGETTSLMELWRKLLCFPWRLMANRTTSLFPEMGWRAGVKEPHWVFSVPIAPSQLGSQPASQASLGPHPGGWVSPLPSSWRPCMWRQLGTTYAFPRAQFCPLLWSWEKWTPCHLCHPHWETICDLGYANNDSFKQLLADLKASCAGTFYTWFSSKLWDKSSE